MFHFTDKDGDSFEINPILGVVILSLGREMTKLSRKTITKMYIAKSSNGKHGFVISYKNGGKITTTAFILDDKLVSNAQRAIDDYYGKTSETIKPEDNNYEVTGEVGKYFWYNEENHTWTIPKGIIHPKATDIYKFEDIANYELIEDGNSITKGGASVGRALAGGLLFGVGGAIIGGSTGKKKTTQVCTDLRIKITLKKFDDPVKYITFLSTSIKKDSLLYKSCFEQAQKILSILDVAVAKNNEIQSSSASIADEVSKLKKLLDEEVITEAEFIAAKKKLLN